MIGRDLPRQKPDDDIWPRTINRLGRALGDRSRGQLLSGYGPALDGRVRRERGFSARLSGSGNPYGFTEVYGKADSSVLTWVDVPSGRTGTAAYEDNGAAGLAGKVVELRPTEFPGVWRFRFSRRSCKWTFTVRGPNSSCVATSLSSKVVNLYQSGVLIATCTTGVSGTCTVDVPAGTYDIEVIGDSTYDTFTQSGVSHTCSQSTTITLSLASGTVCGGSACDWCFPSPGSIFLTGSDGVSPVSDTCIFNSPPAGFPGTPPAGNWFGQTQHPGPFPGNPDYFLLLTCSTDDGTGTNNFVAGWGLYKFFVGGGGFSFHFWGWNDGAGGNTCHPAFNFPTGHPVSGGFGGAWAISA